MSVKVQGTRRPEPTRRRAPSRRNGRRRQAARRRMWWMAAAVVTTAGVVAVVATSVGHHSKSSRLLEVRSVTTAGAGLGLLADAGTADPAVGTTMPALTGASFDGTPIIIAPDGHAKIIVFAAHWCPHCQRELPVLTEWLGSHQLPAGTHLYVVATATRPEAPNYPPSAWLARIGWPSAVLADDAAGTAARAYGVSAYPFFVAVDAAGHVVERTSGELSTQVFATLAARAAGT